MDGIEESGQDNFNPFWHGGAAALLLCAIACAMYYFMARPATDDAVKVYTELQDARTRMQNKREYLHKLKLRCEELEMGDPYALSEALREQLLIGKKNEVVLSEKPAGESPAGGEAQNPRR